jgi:hypothetical protein
MNILKTLRKPYLSLFLSGLILFVSCEQNDLNNEQNNREISLHPFETLKGQLMDVNKLNLNNSRTEFNSRLEQNNYILSEVNSYYGTNIDFDDSLKSLNTEEDVYDWIKSNTTFNQKDVDRLKNFSTNLISLGFDEAVDILENEISDENIDSFKFEKYQSIVNGVALIEYQNPGYFTSENSQGLASRSCAWALFKLGLASASLVGACSPPAMGASVGWTCYVAATAFIAASASVGMECGDQ